MEKKLFVHNSCTVMKMYTFAPSDMKRRLKLLIELVVIVLLSFASPKETSIQSSESSSVRFVRVEIEEQEEVDRSEHCTDSKSDSIDNDGGKKFKPNSAFQERSQLSFIAQPVIGQTHSGADHNCSKSPRYILYCSLIVYA